MSYFWPLLALAAGYLIGSLNSAIVICKILNKPDPRQEGSRNPGATNVARLHGKKAGALVFLGDACKGLLAVLLFRLLGAGWTGQILAGLGVFLGHIYPCFYGFRGGKGVATAFGLLLALHPLLALLVLAVWLAVFAWKRVSSLAALAAIFFSLPLAAVLGSGREETLLLLFIIAMLVYKHRDNIQRLKEGKESSFRR